MDTTSSQTVQPDIALAESLFTALDAGTRGDIGITRATYGAGEQFAHDLLQRTAHERGLDCRIDAAGNLYVTLPGTERALPGILTGSHMDSVPNGGNFDGAAGVIAGMAALAGFAKAGRRFARDITVMAIRGEESDWFAHSYIGSKAALGILPAHVLQIRRRDSGRTLEDHMADAGFDPAALAAGVAQLPPRSVKAYVELHIEQGPMLDIQGIPAAVVTSIRGAARFREVHIIGQETHSGGVPRAWRRDAVVAGADLVMRLRAEWTRLEAEGHDMVLTSGIFSTNPEKHGHVKVPGEVRMSIDSRSADEATLDLLKTRIAEIAAEVAADHGVEIRLENFTRTVTARMDRDMVALFTGEMRAMGIAAHSMASGGGHDAAVFANAGIPSVMLFVRNQNGSHNPDEAMRMEDFAVAATLLARGLARLASQ